MIKGIIFDMDGVISDTQKLHSKIESEIFSKFGVNLSPEEITERYAGVKLKDFFTKVLMGKGCNIEELILEKRRRMREAAEISVDEINGSHNLIKTLHKNNFKLAVASASQKKYVEIVLKKLKVIDFFDAIVGGDMVKKGKPDPESFLLASSKIGVAPENCLVIEDGISGMNAAIAGGMKCIGLVEDKNKKIYPTKNLVISLHEITLSYISSM